MTWASETISRDIEVRALAIATMNTSASLMWLWTPLVLWPVTGEHPFIFFSLNNIKYLSTIINLGFSLLFSDAPRYRKLFLLLCLCGHSNVIWY